MCKVTVSFDFLELLSKTHSRLDCAIPPEQKTFTLAIGWLFWSRITPFTELIWAKEIVPL
jgi:polyferredoxin